MALYNAVYFKITKYHSGTSWSLEDPSPIIHSDTFVSGLIWSYIELYGMDEAKSLIDECVSGGLRVSSLYPSMLYGKCTETFPTPLSYVLKIKSILEEYAENKRVMKKKVGEGKVVAPREKVYLVSKKIFERLINGNFPSAEDVKYCGGVLYMGDEDCFKISKVTIHRNVKDRLCDFTTPWRFSYYTMSDECGLRLVYKVMSRNLSEKKLKAAMTLLSENGLGGERSIGLGYSYDPPIFTTVEINEPANGPYFTTLSLYYPLKSEVQGYSGKEKLSYELVERGGFADPRIGGMRTKIIRMFKQGSVFPCIDGQLGCMVDVGGIYRYGFAFPIRMVWE